MEFYKFALLGVVFSIVILIVKNQEKDIGILLSIAASVLLLFYILDSAISVMSEISEIFEGVNLQEDLLLGVFKIIAIAYITEFACGICEETGSVQLSAKVRIFGKITVLAETLPLISNFISIVGGLL